MTRLADVPGFLEAWQHASPVERLQLVEILYNVVEQRIPGSSIVGEWVDRVVTS